MRRLYLLLSVILCSVGVMWAITTITTVMNNNGNSYYGFTAKLTDTFYSASGDEMADEVNLQTLSIYGRTAGGSGSDFKVAIYQYSADATTGQFVALSDNSNAYQNCGNDNSVSMDFTFTDVTLNKSQQYQFLFVRADATADAISSFEGYKSAAVSISLRMFSNQSLPSGDGTYKSKTLNSWEKSFMPAVKFVLSNPGEGGESGGGDTPEEPEPEPDPVLVNAIAASLDLSVATALDADDSGASSIKKDAEGNLIINNTDGVASLGSDGSKDRPLSTVIFNINLATPTSFQHIFTWSTTEARSVPGNIGLGVTAETKLQGTWGGDAWANLISGVLPTGKHIIAVAVGQSDNSYGTRVYIDGVETMHSASGLKTGGSEYKYMNVIVDAAVLDAITEFYVFDTALTTSEINVAINEIKESYSTLTLVTDPAANAQFTWNGETKYGSTVTYLFKKGKAVNDPSISVMASGYDVTLSATEWDGQNDATVTATLSPAFFTSEAEYEAGNARWVRIYNIRNSNYAIWADDAANLHSGLSSLTNESELFAMVGSAESFKLYSKVKQTYFGSADNNQNTAVVAEGANSTYKLIMKTGDNAGYLIVPTGNENQSFNMHGGAGKDIKYYAATDGGATWRVVLVGDPLTLKLNCEGEPSTMNKLVGSFSFTADGVVYSINVSVDNLNTERAMYLPKFDNIALNEGSFITYKGYEYLNSSLENDVLTVNYRTTEARWLFQTVGHGRPYRIPAIAKAKNGDLIAISDDRFCGSDIGYGRVDLVYKVSHDNGMTWSENDIMLAQGDGNNESNTCGYGDAAICADRTSNKVMVMAVSAPNGGTCWTAAQRGVITWGTLQDDGTCKWEVPVDIKDELMALLPTDRINYFVGSGKISQSHIVKKGDYYRVYVALWTTGAGGLTNYVVYSDEFGKPGSWRLLGEKTVRPVPGGDEPKAEELPNGSVVVSGRKGGGRYYNIFTFADDTYESGSWSTAVASNSVQGGLSWGGNSTNGEIMVVKAMRRSDNTMVNIALQSAPAGNDRSLVSIWYKIITSADDYSSPTVFSQGWTKGMQVCDFLSAYSTMCIQADSRIAFFYEDGQSGAAYDMIYQPISLGKLEGLEDYYILPEGVAVDEMYTITFDTDGGSDIAPITQVYTSEVLPPSDPTKTGYTFLGWETDIPSNMPAGDMTIKAKWQINQYTVKFVSDDVVVSESKLDYASVIEAPADPSKTGYTFMGWSPAFEKGATVPAEDITYTAQWQINQYTITFDTDGGSDISPITQDYNSEVTAPENPTKTGYTFLRWEPEIPTTMPAEDVTIKAQWTINSYRLTYMVDGEVYKEYILEYGAAITPEPAPEKTDWQFSGWKEEIPSTMPAEDVVITGSFDVYTSILSVNGAGDENAEIYDVNGTKLAKAKQGLNIVNNKKVMVR